MVQTELRRETLAPQAVAVKTVPLRGRMVASVAVSSGRCRVGRTVKLLGALVLFKREFCNLGKGLYINNGWQLELTLLV